MRIKWPWLGGKSSSWGEVGSQRWGQSFPRRVQSGSWGQDPWLCPHSSDQPLGGLRWLLGMMGLSFLARKLWGLD